MRVWVVVLVCVYIRWGRVIIVRMWVMDRWKGYRSSYSCGCVGVVLL